MIGIWQGINSTRKQQRHWQSGGIYTETPGICYYDTFDFQTLTRYFTFETIIRAKQHEAQEDVQVTFRSVYYRTISITPGTDIYIGLQTNITGVIEAASIIGVQLQEIETAGGVVYVSDNTDNAEGVEQDYRVAGASSVSGYKWKWETVQNAVEGGKLIQLLKITSGLPENITRVDILSRYSVIPTLSTTAKQTRWICIGRESPADVT